jgi:hypothetical protein
MLIAISIVKSIIIDTQVLRFQYNGGPKPALIHMDSIYSALVSIFKWATGLVDPLLAGNSRVNIPENATTMHEIRQLVKVHFWAEWKIKSTREFLLGLGQNSSWLFNGFIIQKERLTARIAEHSAQSSMLNDMGAITERTSEEKIPRPVNSQYVLHVPSDSIQIATGDSYDSYINRVSENSGSEREAALHNSSPTLASTASNAEPLLSGRVEVRDPEDNTFLSVM